MQSIQTLVSELETLGTQVQTVASRLAHASGNLELPSNSTTLQQLHQLRHSAESRANRAEAQVVRLQRSLEKETQQSHTSAQELQRLAYQDALTGLANANLLAQHVEGLLAHLEPGLGLLVMLVDVDHFSVLNQMLGHEQGDQMLIRIAERLQEMMNEQGGAAGRPSEDEFALILTVPLAEAEQRAAQMGQAVRQRLGAPFLLQGQQLTLTVSQGACYATQGPGSTLLHRARVALTDAKSRGRNQLRLFSPDFERQQRRESTLEFQLGFALESGELFFEYLPIIWLDSEPGGSVKGRLIGVEALLRWNHRSEGVLPAAQFLAAAERSGRIVAIGERMLEAACAQVARWRKEGADLYLNFNLSGRELLVPGLAARAAEVADREGVARERLTFEFCENYASLDEEMIDRTVSELRLAGFPLALDSFGAGVSSLRRLSEVQFLKLSPRLLQDDPALVGKALAIAGGLGLVTVGVGVENGDQARWLVQQGCPSVQGFFFSPPLDPDGVLELYRSKPRWTL